MTRNEALCAVSFMLTHEADLAYYNLDSTAEEIKAAHEQMKLSDRLAADGNASDETTWHRAVVWATGGEL